MEYTPIEHDTDNGGKHRPEYNQHIEGHKMVIENYEKIQKSRNISINLQGARILLQVHKIKTDRYRYKLLSVY